MKDQSSEKMVGRLVDLFIELRKSQGLSHEKLALKTGMTRPAISLIESKKRIPTILTCFRIAQALGVSLGALVKKAEKEG